MNSIGRTHARVDLDDNGNAWLRCIEPDGIVLVDTKPVRELPLKDGVGFFVGRTEFWCISGSRDRAGEVRSFDSCPCCGSKCVTREDQEIFPCPSCNGPVLSIPTGQPDRPRLILPADFGRYRAIRFVARGGMGLVILGAIKETDEPVAIKILFSDTPNNRTDADRFRQEVETMGRMQHPNIVRLLDHGMAGTYNYLVMEWIDGPSLRQVITNTNQANRPLGFNDALRWLQQVVKGLEAIHSSGMVHRDIKPSNILIGSDGVARITDLGLAKRINIDATSYTTTGNTPGTFFYMAPEQLNTPDAVDARADQYALGVTFYELLTGAKPFGTWLPASKINPNVPESFDTILARLLSPKPSCRYSDMREFASTILNFSLPVVAKTTLDEMESKSTAPVLIGNPSTTESTSIALGTGKVAWERKVGMWLARLLKPDPPPGQVPDVRIPRPSSKNKTVLIGNPSTTESNHIALGTGKDASAGKHTQTWRNKLRHIDHGTAGKDVSAEKEPQPSWIQVGVGISVILFLIFRFLTVFRFLNPGLDPRIPERITKLHEPTPGSSMPLRSPLPPPAHAGKPITKSEDTTQQAGDCLSILNCLYLLQATRGNPSPKRPSLSRTVRLHSISSQRKSDIFSRI